MATTIVTKSGSGAPAASDLVAGELAVDLTNKRLYTEDSSAAIIELGTNPSGNVTFGDNGKAIFGAGSDLQIYHDGSNSYVKDNGVGDLIIQAYDDIKFQQSTDNADLVTINTGGNVTIHGGNLDVTGSVTADGLTVNVNNDIKISRSGTSSQKLFWDRSGVVDGSLELGADENLTLSVADDGRSGQYIYFNNNTKRVMSLADGGDLSLYEDTGTTPKFVWDASAESLGIGTSSPATALHLSGATGAAPKLTFEEGGAESRIYATKNSPTNSDLRFQTEIGGTIADRMVIDYSGNVGIGTSSPARPLHVSTSGVIPLRLTSTGTDCQIELGNSGGTPIIGSFNDQLLFNTASTERMRIDASGNVGISNSIPSSFNAGANNLVVGSGSGSEGITIYGGGESNIFFADGTAGSAAYIGRIEYSHSVNNMLFYVNNSNAMTIDDSGNVGIGVVPNTGWRSEATALQISPLGAIYNTSNYEDFNIANNVYTDGTDRYIQNDAACKIRLTDAGLMDFRVAGAGSAGAAISWTTAMTLDASGRVGIGVAPTGSLHTTVKDSSGSDVFVVAQNTTNNRIAGFKVLDESGTTSLLMQYDNGSNTAKISNPNNGSLGIYLGGSGAANLLDDYEEGTWTPTVSSGTLSISHASYTKIGNRVYATMEIVLSGTRSGSGTFSIAGLPFTVSDWTSAVCYTENYNLEGSKQLTAAYQASATQLVFIADGLQEVGTDFGNGYLNVSGFYRTTA